jgi:large subunit ribosomal protein L17
MRHGKKLNHLSRTSAHRKAMMANMASSLILNKRIKTTTAKAKALRTFVEPLITKAKTDNTHSRRVVFRYLQDKYAVSELFRDVAEKIANRPGGYTRILKTGNRQGDNAEMCFIELVDYNDTYTSSEGKKSKSSRRRRRRGGKKKSQVDAQQTQEESAASETTQEESSEEQSQQAQTQQAPEEGNQPEQNQDATNEGDQKKNNSANKNSEDKKE